MTTLSPQPEPQPDLSAMQRQLTDRFAHFARRVRGQVVLAGLVRVAAVVLALVLLSLLVDWWLELGRAMRIALLLLSAAGVAWYMWREVAQPMRMPLDAISLAAAMDRSAGAQANDQLAPRVATVLQMSGILANRDAPSQAMAQAAAQRSYDRLQAVDLAQRVDDRHMKWQAGAMAALLLLPLLSAVLLPQVSGLWAQRWILGRNVAWPRATTLTVLGAEDGILIVPRGEPTVVRVRGEDKPRPTEAVYLHLDVADGPTHTDALTRFDVGDFRHDLPPLNAPATLWLRGGDARLGPITITPLHRPRLVDLTLRYRHPRDESEQTHRFTGAQASPALLPHTEASLTLVANVPLAEVRSLTADDEQPVRLQRVDDRTFEARWTHHRPVQLRLELVAAEAPLTSHPLPVAVGLRPDRPPQVRLAHSGVRQRITPVATIPLKAEAHDDFGVAALFLHARGETPSYHVRLDDADQPTDEASGTGEKLLALFGPITPTEHRRREASHELNAADFTLVPGDLLHLHASASDDRYGEPQTGQSQTLVFRVVSSEELFRELLLRQQELRSRFRQATQDAHDLGQRMEAATLPDDADDLLRRFRLNQRQVWQVLGSLGESVLEMRLNQLGGSESHDMIERSVIAPLTRLHDQTMARQREAIGEAARSAPGSETAAELGQRQQQIATEMDKVLQQMTQWDSFIDVINQLNEIINVQQNVQQRTDQLREDQVESIFDD